MCSVYSGDEEPQMQDVNLGDYEHRYSEGEIQQVVSDLLGYHNEGWSKNPRLYIALRDIGLTSNPRVLDKFIENDINDIWLPILSKSLLADLLPAHTIPYFLRAQSSVCSLPSEFRLGIKSTHGHFSSKDFPPFSTRRVIGSGHIGDVDEVRSLVDGKFYARKIISRRLSHFTSASKHIRSFRRELQALRRIDHVHCVKLAGSYTNPRHLAIIMSPVAECNLKQYLERAESSPDPVISARLKNWFGCLASAIQYLHRIKIRHRDIKPDNILVHRRRVLLVDFELSLDWKDLAQSTTTADCGGTPLYAAPEVILHKKRNSSSDIWSLGCVFLEMATVLKGKRICDMRDLFKSQAESAIFYNNQRGISQWITLLTGLSTVGNEPFLWISEMLQHDKDLRPKAGVVLDLIRNSRAPFHQPTPYLGKCCQQDEERIDRSLGSWCSCKPRSEMDDLKHSCCNNQTAMTYRSRICRNPESTSEGLPVQRMRASFYPYFISRHLTRASMEGLTQSIVAESLWDSFDANASVSCLPGQPLHLRIRRFIPKFHIFSCRTDPESGTLQTQESLPVGIYEADPIKLARSFNEYLNNIVDNHLVEQTEFILQIWEPDHSNRVLNVLFRWFQRWKQTLPIHEAFLLKTAIKIVIISKILRQSQLLEEMPAAFANSYFHGCSGPQNVSSDKESPRLVNRQVKVAFFLLQSMLLEQIISTIRSLLRVPESWTACLFSSMCLSFILERMLVDSQVFVEVVKELYENETPTRSDAQNYCHGVYNVIFQRIYRLLRTGMRIEKRDSKIGAAEMQLLQDLRGLNHQFDVEGKRRSQPDVQARYPSPLVSALLDLLEPA